MTACHESDSATSCRWRSVLILVAYQPVLENSESSPLFLGADFFRLDEEEELENQWQEGIPEDPYSQPGEAGWNKVT